MTDASNDRSATTDVTDLFEWATARSRRRHPSTWTADATPLRIDDHSPAALWRSDFEIHADQHADVTTSGLWVLAPVLERALRTSLPIFQVGEVGTGRHLLDSACGTVGEDHLQALRLFVIESQEHARLLAMVCTALEIDMIDEHWSERFFRSTRHRRGVRTELLAIVIAQLVSADIYGTLAEGIGDPTLSRIFHRLQADELRHLEFHAATLPEHLSWRRPVRSAIRAAWVGAAHAVALAVTWEHRALLAACGRTRRSFFTDLIHAVNAQATRLFD